MPMGAKVLRSDARSDHVRPEDNLSSRQESLNARKDSLLDRLTALRLSIHQGQVARMSDKTMIRRSTIPEGSEESGSRHSVMFERSVNGYEGAIIGRTADRVSVTQDQRVSSVV